jgi:hypothetical protein
VCGICTLNTVRKCRRTKDTHIWWVHIIERCVTSQTVYCRCTCDTAGRTSNTCICWYIVLSGCTGRTFSVITITGQTVVKSWLTCRTQSTCCIHKVVRSTKSTLNAGTWSTLETVDCESGVHRTQDTVPASWKVRSYRTRSAHTGRRTGCAIACKVHTA